MSDTAAPTPEDQAWHDEQVLDDRRNFADFVFHEHQKTRFARYPHLEQPL